MADAGGRGEPTANEFSGRGESLPGHGTAVVPEHEAAQLVDAALGKGAFGIEKEAACPEGEMFDGGAGAFHVAFWGRVRGC